MNHCQDSQELAEMKEAQFLTITRRVELFNKKLEKFNKLSLYKISISLAMGFLKTAISGNNQLLHASILCDIIQKSTNTDVAHHYRPGYPKC